VSVVTRFLRTFPTKVTHAASTSGEAKPQEIRHEIRITGVVQAVHATKILVPQITVNTIR